MEQDGFDVVCTDMCDWGTYAATLEEAKWLRSRHYSTQHRVMIFDRFQQIPVKLKQEAD